MDTVRIQFNFTPEEFLKALTYHSRHHTNSLARWVAYLIGIALALLSIWTLATTGFAATPIAVLLISVYIIWLRPYAQRRTLYRRFKNDPNANQVIDCEFTDTEFVTRTNDSESRVKWTGFVKRIETPEGFLLYPTERNFLWLPFKAFDVELDLNTITRLIREKVQHA